MLDIFADIFEDVLFSAGKIANHDVYQASPIKRKRATRADMEDRRLRLWTIVREMRPMTVRQVFYQATVRGIVDKSEAGYTKVQTDLVQMRKSGMLPYDWLADNTRWQRKPRTFDSIEQALNDTARFYRKSLWTDAGSYVEVWLEKDALAGVVQPITALYDVPLMVARGYASLSFLHSAAEYIASLDVPTFIYHCGDFDLSNNAVSLDAFAPRLVSLGRRRRLRDRAGLVAGEGAAFSQAECICLV
ncbi:hypothetical protein HNQ71_000093 [Mesorhizobium sangaii]|uniref:Uncharacterized protein n=1 Tax=Mesorhizobium sangaii TaxID=505389 RepID=A0A841PC62_9HYPH|nr:hypothetical protein [Mesorhizobium sangaii]